MKSNIFIPKKINVGYQKRSDTYTGKLAYVIYYDEKGKLRKETSWNSWRDEKIPNEEFENVPISGFVLNKKVGDYSNGWDHRQAYCRVYDPRNFEFEINIENLLYILENANSIKGKGLEGEFVYGWDGKDLVLIPVESPDYKQIAEYNKIVHNSECIKAKDLIIGATYLTKNNEEQIYVGKYEYYDYCGANAGKQFWFAHKHYDYKYVNGERVYTKDYTWAFVVYKNLSGGKLIKCLDDNCTGEYSIIFDALEHYEYYCPYDQCKDEYVNYSFDEFEKFISEGKITFLSSKNMFNEAFHYDILKEDNTNLYVVKMSYRWNPKNSPEYKDYINRFKFDVKEVRSYYWSNVTEKEYTFIPTTLEDIYQRLNPCYKIEYLKNGNEKRRIRYYE